MSAKSSAPDEQALWDDFARAFAQFEKDRTELNRVRVIRDFTRWSLAFSPTTTATDVLVLRSRLKVER